MHSLVCIQVLTSTTAARLQERLELLSTLRRGVSQLRPGWEHEKLLARLHKELPPWWSPASDVGLVNGVLKHGFGNWSSIFQVRQSCRMTSSSAD